jgi:hypothetical protein
MFQRILGLQEFSESSITVKDIEPCPEGMVES